MKNLKFLSIMAVIVLVIAIGLSFFLSRSKRTIDNITEQKFGRNEEIILSSECGKYGGIWREEYQECENVSRELCEFASGVFFTCESPCRHEQGEAAEAYLCGVECVPVCKFGDIGLPTGQDPENASYLIEGEVVALVDGQALNKDSSDPTQEVKIKIFDKIITGDINEDGLDDSALMLTRQVGDSEPSYYVSLALNQKDYYQGANALLVGQEIDFLGMQIIDKMVRVDYYENSSEEASTEQARVGISKYAVFKKDKLVELKIDNEKLKMYSPPPFSFIISPVVVSGWSNFFEANTRIRIKDDAGNVLADTSVKAEGSGDQLYHFLANVDYSEPKAARGVIEVFEEASETKQEINKVFIPIVFNGYKETRGNENSTEEASGALIGGETDDHGCLGPAGYAWDEVLGACARPWELDETAKVIAKAAVDEVGRNKGLTVLEIKKGECDNCFFVILQQGQEKRMEVEIKDMKAVKVNAVDLE